MMFNFFKQKVTSKELGNILFIICREYAEMSYEHYNKIAHEYDNEAKKEEVLIFCLFVVFNHLRNSNKLDLANILRGFGVLYFIQISSKIDILKRFSEYDDVLKSGAEGSVLAQLYLFTVVTNLLKYKYNRFDDPMETMSLEITIHHQSKGLIKTIKELMKKVKVINSPHPDPLPQGARIKELMKKIKVID